MEQTWQTDILGKPFKKLTMDLGKDDEGPLSATLVRSLPKGDQGPHGRVKDSVKELPLHDVDVLYVHGWSDYFFQTDLAFYWNQLGARFYALDLRKYGRSLRRGQTPGYIDDLRKYDLDINTAISHMHTKDQKRRLVLFGHSTGGLTLTLWASRHPGAASALILNSPWLEFQTGRQGRHALMPFIHMHASRHPKDIYPETDLGYYTKAQKMVGSLPEHAGPQSWRPSRGFATRPGWLHAVMEGQESLTHDVNIGTPSLVLLSAKNTQPFGWTDNMKNSDSVLVVDDIARVAAHIFPEVTIARLQGALHDVFLSAPNVRARAYEMLGSWLLGGALAPAKNLPPPPPLPKDLKAERDAKKAEKKLRKLAKKGKSVDGQPVKEPETASANADEGGSTLSSEEKTEVAPAETGATQVKAAEASEESEAAEASEN